jgi:hypothetical protein
MSFKKVTLYLFILIVFSPVTYLKSQVKTLSFPEDQPLRIEINCKTDNETYRVIPCGKSGVILFFKSVETVEETNVKWYFSLYDENLRRVWVKSLPVNLAMEFKSVAFRKDTLALLFQATGKGKPADYNFSIIRLLLDPGTFIVNTGTFPENVDPDQFLLYGETAITSLNVKNESARIWNMDLSTGTSLNFQLTPGLVSDVSCLEVDTTGARIVAAIRKQFSKNKYEYYLSQFDLAGNMITEALVSPVTPERYLQNAEFVRLNTEEYLVFGSYGSSPVQKGMVKNTVIVESTGFFYSRISGNQQKNIAFYNFLEFKNAGNLLDKKDIMMLRKKAMKKNLDLNSFSLDYTLLLHPVIRRDSTFILMAEAFNPQYHSETFTDFDYYGRPFTNSYSVFDGYRYNSAIITGFDEKGKLLWDNNMEIRNLISFDLDKKVNTIFTADDIVLTYQGEGKLASKIIRGYDVVEKLDYSPVEMSLPDDKLLSETKSKMIPWYDNYFLCSGYQEIRNVALEGNNKRLVYYFSKIKFE